MMEFINQPFPIYKTAEGPNGQKVVCTPEVSLYQYNSPDLGANGLNRLEDKGGGHPNEVGLPTTAIHPGEQMPGSASGESATGSTSSTTGFQCGFCGKTFQQKNTFQNHLRSHREGDDPYACDICGKTFAVPARLTRHYRTHTGEKPYQCEYCNKSFSVKENLSVHRRIHTKERPYKCEVCERAFEHSGKLHRHMRIHTGERPHRCQICQKTFIQSGQLVIHMRTHTGEKPYVCKVCNKGFTCSKQLKVHTRTHTGEKPYTCDICGKSFGYNHVLKLHQVAHYGEKVYKCTICNGTFTSKKALESHIKTHSEGSVPTEPTSPVNNIEPSVLSPSSLSQTPQNSDKENRESSDSEISSQNSPHESPKTPPSPVIYAHNHDVSSRPHQQHHPPQFKTNTTTTSIGNFNRANGNGFIINRESNYVNNNSNKVSNISKSNLNPATNLPYPMLPPGVQVHQSPQSRTTFLYVTSKLPVSPINSSGPSRSDSPPPQLLTAPPRHFSQVGSNPSLKQTAIYTSPSNPNFKVFGGGLLNNGSGGGLNNKIITEAPVQRDKLFLANASIRDKKVLPFLEQFGYGLPKDQNVQQQHHQHNFNRGDFDIRSEIESRHKSLIQGGIPENFMISGNSYNNRNRRSPPVEMLNRYSTESRESRRSPEILEYNSSSSYTPGGVLALALTRGSKAVMQQGSNNSFRQQSPDQRSNNSARSRSPDEIFGLDFSSRRSVSPTRNSSASLTPTSRSPRSSPGLNDESMEEMGDDQYQKSSEEEMNNNDIIRQSGGKRRASSNGGGPRKRSSLILEKYAQENPATPQPPSSESILSQRLRLSSVIQYAEKCS